MKRTQIATAILVFLSGTFFAASPTCAQGSRHDDVVRGEQGIPVAGATVVVCTQPANVTITPCTPLANLFTDASLTIPAPNPLTSDGLGNFHFYAAPGLYTVQVYGPGINTYTTPDVLLPTNPGNAQFGNITATNGITALTLSLGGNLSVGGNANVTGTLTAGSLAANLAATSNAELKAFPGDAILYVSPSGSDANDGKSPGSAMATLYHAICSLPNGNCSTQTAGSGTVYFFSSSAANPTSTCGLWLMGTIDPNYASPPACWLKTVNGSNGLTVIGIPQFSHGPNPQRPDAHISGGSATDRSHPALGRERQFRYRKCRGRRFFATRPGHWRMLHWNAHGDVQCGQRSSNQ